MTGNCNEKVQNKNLYNDVLQVGTINGSGNDSSSTTNTCNKHYIDVKSNTTYTISAPINKNVAIRYYDTNENFVTSDVTGALPKTFTVPNGCAKMRFVLVDNTDTSISIQIEENSTATDYITHAEQNAPLTLGDIELYDGDKIQISYVNKAGYKKVTGANVIKKCNEYTFDGSIEGDYTFKDDNTNTISVNLYPNQIDQGILKGTNDIPIYCSDFLYVNDLSDTEHLYVTAATPVTGGWKGNTRIYLNKTRLTGYSSSLTNAQKLNLFKTYLTQNPITIAYKSVQSTTTPITDTTLLSQLETLINMKTYKEVTHIDATGADLTPVLEFNYYKDMTTIFDNLEARVELLEN